MAEKTRYDGYVETLKDAIALRIKKQGEKKLEKSLQRSMTSLHRRESEDADRIIQGLPRNLARVNGNGFSGRREGSEGLSIVPGGREVDFDGDDESEVATTPVAATRR